MRRLTFSILVLVIAAFVGRADACANVVYSYDAEVKKLKKAEAYLEKGKYKQARKQAEKVKGTPRSDDPFDGGPSPEQADEIKRRKNRVMAVADLRLGEVSAAMLRLRELTDASPDDPYLRARLAEGLSQTDGGDKEALEVLEDLKTRDLMPDAEAWATLATLYARAEKTTEHDEAIAKCKELAPSKSKAKKLCK